MPNSERSLRDLAEAVTGLRGDLVVTSELAERTEKLAKENEKLNEKNQKSIVRNRFLLGLDIVLTILVSFGFVQTHSSSNQAKHNAAQVRQAVVVSCQKTNEHTKIDKEFWLSLLSLPPQPGQPPPNPDFIATIKAQLDSSYVPVDCQSLLRIINKIGQK